MSTVPIPDPSPFEIRDPGPTPAGIELSVELLTPDLANDLLLANPFNRKQRRPHIQKLAGAMARGEFRFNGDPIRVSVDGDLLDGQHRCEAVRESGQSIWSVIIRGLPVDVIHTIDTDMAPRNLRDVLKIGGEMNHDLLATALVWKWRKETGTLQTKELPTPAQALAILEKYPELRKVAAQSAGSKVLKVFKLNRGQIAALLYEFRSVDAEDAARFFEKLTHGAGLAEGDPILRLRSWLQKMASVEVSKRATPVEVYMTIIKAWNYWRSGGQAKSVVWVGSKHVPVEPR